jgi:DNA polymerase III epsilon subunit-like protein
MSEYQKCACPHCGQSIEYPAEGTGQAVPCPTCEKPVTLTPTNQPQADGEAQRKKELDEWIALNKRLKERWIQSGITAPPIYSEAQTSKRWLIVDTETDGLTAPIHVVEIAAQLMEGWEKCGEPFQIFLNHNVHIPRRAVAIHGYTQEFLQAHGCPPLEAHEAFRQYAGELPIVAHSLGYDWNRALVPEWVRLGLKPIGCRGFCTVTLSRRVLPEAESYSLDVLKSRFGLGEGLGHKAGVDVETVVRLFREILRPRLESAGLTTFEAWQRFSKQTPVADCWRLIDPSRAPKTLRREVQIGTMVS